MTATLPRDEVRGTRSAAASPVIETLAGTGVVVVEDEAQWPRTAYTHALCQGLGERGVPVLLMTPRRFALPDAAAGSYVTDPRWRSLQSAPKLLRPLLAVANLWTLLWALRRTRANVVVRAAGAPSRLDLIFVRILHIVHRRVVWVAHRVAPDDAGGDDGDDATTLPRWCRKLYRKVDEIAVTSQAAANELVVAMPQIVESVRVVPYGDFRYLVDERPNQTEARRLLGVPARLPVALCVCDEADTAAVVDFLDALDRLRLRGTPVGAMLAGTSVDASAQSLTAMIEARGMTETVQIVPADRYLADVAQVYAAADIVVLANRRDPEPEKALYAFAHARPTVVTDIGGFPEVVLEQVNGAVVRPADPEMLASGIASLTYPRRRLQQLQYDLERRVAETEPWSQITARFEPMLARDDVIVGRRISAKGTGLFMGIVWGLILFTTIAALVANAEQGLTTKNLPLIVAIAFPFAAIFVLVIPYDVKFYTYFAVLCTYDIAQRYFMRMPIKYVPSLIVGTMVLHLFLQTPKDRPVLKGTRFFHVLLMLQFGWAVAEIFNPNIDSLPSSVKMIRLLIEPFLVYICALTYFRSIGRIHTFFRFWIWLGFFCTLYGLKIAFLGYFSFELETVGQIGIAESRNIGTMGNAMVWGLFQMQLFFLCFALLLERKVMRPRLLLYFMIPATAMGMVSAGQRIQFLGLGVGAMLVLFFGLGHRATRTRAVVALVVAAFTAFLVWNWIPNEASSRKDLYGKSPISAARLKLATIKEPSKDADTTRERIKNGSATVKAIISQPLGGGTGLIYVAPVDSQSALGGTNLLGDEGAQESRARNQVPVQVADFFYINWLAEQGIPGLILITLIFLTICWWNLYMAWRARDPIIRAVCVAGFAFGVGYVINSITNAAFYSPVSSALLFTFAAVPICAAVLEEKAFGPIPSLRERMDDERRERMARRAARRTAPAPADVEVSTDVVVPTNGAAPTPAPAPDVERVPVAPLAPVTPVAPVAPVASGGPAPPPPV